MKQLSQFLTLLFILFHLNSKAQSDIQKDLRLDPLLKQIDAKRPGLRIFARNDGEAKYVNMAVLSDSARMLTWFTCYGQAFEAVQLTDDIYNRIESNSLNPFDYYKGYFFDLLSHVRKAAVEFRQKGEVALRDTGSIYHKVYTYPPVQQAKSMLQKEVAIERVMSDLLLKCTLFDARTPNQLPPSDTFQLRLELAGRMIKKGDTTTYYNSNPLSSVARIVLCKQAPGKMLVYDQHGQLADSVPLKADKFASLINEKQDVFLLYRGWLELQSEQAIARKEEIARLLNREYTMPYKPAYWKEHKQQLQQTLSEVQEQVDVAGNKVMGLIVPSPEETGHLLATVYQDKPSEISYMPGLGFAYAVVYTRGNKRYELTDHRGNVMAVVSDKKKPEDENGDGVVEYYNPDVVSAVDYLPFGGQMQGRTYSSGDKYRYGFNGKENDNEVKGDGDQQDYGMRIYDPRVGRFLSTDPITKQYPELSPYQFASNRVIDGIDLDGLEFTPGMYDYKSALYIGNLTMATDKKMNRQQIETWGNAMNDGSRKGTTLGAALAVDAYTGGRLSMLLTTTQIYSAFQHNKANTADGRQIQEEESRNALLGAALGWGLGKIVGNVLRLGWTFKEEVKYLFRGTSEGFEGLPSLQRLSMTPTSSDPVVATIFATNAENYGKGILQVAIPKNLQGVEFSSNVLSDLEKEIAVGLKPAEFTAKVSVTITSKEARNILEGMGIKLPSKVALEDVSNTIRNSPRLNQGQIDEFYQKVSQLKK